MCVYVYMCVCVCVCVSSTRYAHYDNNPSFSDFSAFGGWSSPHAKQYAGDVTQCSLSVDKNYAKGRFHSKPSCA